MSQERAPVSTEPTDHETRARASRRGLMLAGASAAMWAAFARRTQAQQTRLPAGSHARLAPQPAGDLRFLVDRATHGWTPEVWARAQELGYAGWLEEQLDHTAIDDSALNALLAGLPTLTMTSKQIYDTYVVPGQTGVPVAELETAVFLRAVHSKRQLFERMVEFWTDHFNLDHADNQIQWLKTADDRDVVRAHALGNFQNLLLASAQSGAMLFYLDNYRNFASAPNENYSRELMELHTLGVGNYTEADVIELARCLTGWQYWNQSQPNHGDFRFNAGQHDNGSKTVLGQLIPANGGINDGLVMLAFLALHPATAQFLARKLCRFFLTYDPPQALVDAVANAYISSGADIKSTLRAVFAPANVALIAPGAQVKVKRPFTLVTSMVRACNPTITQANRYAAELALMGHQPMRWSPPDGYPDTAAHWGTAVLPRWNFVSRLANSSITGTTVNVAVLFGDATKSALAARADQILTGGRLDPADVAAVQAYANAATTLNDTLRRDVLTLAASSPSFQYV